MTFSALITLLVASWMSAIAFATYITNCLKNGGLLGVARQMDGHENSRTTGL